MPRVSTVSHLSTRGLGGASISCAGATAHGVGEACWQWGWGCRRGRGRARGCTAEPGNLRQRNSSRAGHTVTARSLPGCTAAIGAKQGKGDRAQKNVPTSIALKQKVTNSREFSLHKEGESQVNRLTKQGHLTGTQGRKQTVCAISPHTREH